VASVAAALLLYAAYSTAQLPFFGFSGWGVFLLLLGLTLVTSGFTVPVTQVQ